MDVSAPAARSSRRSAPPRPRLDRQALERRAGTIRSRSSGGLNYSTRRSMLRTHLVCRLLLDTTLVIVASASAAVPTLKGTDGPGFTISLNKGTTKVTKVKAGKYKIVINDLSNIHNFHLTG